MRLPEMEAVLVCGPSDILYPPCNQISSMLGRSVLVVIWLVRRLFETQQVNGREHYSYRRRRGRSARTGRNPARAEIVQLAAKWTGHCKLGKELRTRVDLRKAI